MKSPAPLPIGSLLADKYRVLRQLGAGSFGVVWLCEPVAGGSPCVVKMLHQEWAGVAEVVERFRREAVATDRVHHPNICRFHEFAVTQQGIPYIAMEYLAGDTLRNELAKRGALPFGRAAALLAPVCDALATAHAAGIVHRDLKPENIMVTERHGREDAVLLDFGVAKLLDAGDKLTQLGAMLGTPSYMSPEQCRGQKDVGPPTDVYALGAIFFELVTGRPPFVAQTVAELAIKHVLEPAPPLAGAPPYLAAIIAACLGKDAGARPSASEFGRVLAQAGMDPHAAALAIAAAPTAPDRHSAPTVISSARSAENETPAPSPAAPGRSGVSWGIIVLVAVTLGAIGCLLALYLR